MIIKEQYIPTTDGDIFVKIWTPEIVQSKISIVLLHDSLGSCNQWRDFPEKLANTLFMQVIAYDRAGFGNSYTRHTLPSINFIEEEADVYFPQVKKALELGRFIILGHSVGGGMAVNIAANEKDCLGAVTISAQAFIEERTLEGIQNAKQALQRPEMLSKIAKWHGEKAQWVINAWTEIWLSDEFRNWKLCQVKNVFCPLLAIHGENDEYGSTAFPNYIVQNSSASAQVEIIENCGHMPHVTHTEVVLKAIASFIKSVIDLN
ncbi:MULTISPECIES: alpha/beta fold hydrolase [Salinimonas]|uniref:Alpha/beta hydrolase n=2 Tax=Salinimonas TaxID=288793 RepID=A0A5B7YJ11_9ALTE|nr:MULTISPECIES: alpha/beta hydrolase [Salinimonas]MBD3587660.1 alpha/beta hydrolase [Salinimonas profundi]QCZ95436.1 alpha/beta hydrolase [Salinimonas iocasae]|tara:strand:+ start:1657 stop:2442 length:786 start_codon:yes stop_codon:yes gene_type:complete